MLQQKIYWHDTLRMPSADSVAPLPKAVDAAVIGGGYTGLSAARQLAGAGLRVALLEAESIGWGASSRNGGMVLTGLKVGMQTVVRRYGLERARRLWQASLDAVDLVERNVREGGIDCGFSRSGHVYLASKPGHYAALLAEAEFMEKNFAHAVRLLPGSQQHTEVASDRFYGGLIDDLSGGLNPAQYMAGLARLAESSGALLLPQTRLLRIERGAAGFRLQTSRGDLTASRVFVATAGYTDHSTPYLTRRIVPIGSYIIATERLPLEITDELIPRGRMLFDSRHFLHYFRLWDQRMIFGGRAAFFPESASTIRRSAGILRRDLVGIFPQLRDVAVEYVWGGTLDFAFDTMPHVGEVDGIAYALGYAGHGVALGTYLGKTAAQAMLDRTLNDHPFCLDKFPRAPLGLYNGTPWFLPFAGAWYRVLDFLG